MTSRRSRRLTVDDLPAPAATLEAIIRFSRRVDPTMDFIRQWGDDYKENAMALWRRCNEAFRQGADLDGLGVDERLLCLNYDIALGPYLGVPAAHKRVFFNWLIDGIRTMLVRPEAT